MPFQIEAPLAAARELLTASDIPWAVAGGWALDLFLGRETRDHADLDLAVWRADQHKLQSAAAPDWELQVAEDGALRPWTAGEWLSPPIHEIHARRVRHADGSLELLLNERDETAWIYRRDPEIRRELNRAILTRDGIPLLAPEIVLLYKSRTPRLTDQADFRVALPALTTEQRDWLRRAIMRSNADHPWLGSGVRVEFDHSNARPVPPLQIRESARLCKQMMKLDSDPNLKPAASRPRMGNQ